MSRRRNRGQQREPRQHEIAHLVDAEPPVGAEERRALEHAHRADVHRVLGALQVQEARVERGEAVVLAHVRAIVGRTLATVYGVDLVPTAVWKISPELVLALDEHLGPPVDSYVNGSQTWLVGDEAGDHADETDARRRSILEFRLHPVSGYQPPDGLFALRHLGGGRRAVHRRASTRRRCTSATRPRPSDGPVGRARGLSRLRRRDRARAARERRDRRARARARSHRPRRPRSDRRRVGTRQRQGLDRRVAASTSCDVTLDPR